MTTQQRVQMDCCREGQAFVLVYEVTVANGDSGQPLYGTKISKIVDRQMVEHEETGAFTASKAVAEAVSDGLARNRVTPMGLCCAADILLETLGGL